MIKHDHSVNSNSRTHWYHRHEWCEGEGTICGLYLLLIPLVYASWMELATFIYKLYVCIYVLNALLHSITQSMGERFLKHGYIAIMIFYVKKIKISCWRIRSHISYMIKIINLWEFSPLISHKSFMIKLNT